MPFKRFDNKRGHYELLTWGQLALLIGAALVVVALIVVYALVLRPVDLTPEQQAILQNINCLRQRAGNAALVPDRGLVAQAQELAALFPKNEWTATQQVTAAGGQVRWAVPGTDLAPDDPCLWRWFVPLDISSPIPAVVSDPGASRIGIGYAQVARPAMPGRDPTLEEVVVYIVR